MADLALVPRKDSLHLVACSPQKSNKALLEAIQYFFNNLAPQCFAEQCVLGDRDSAAKIIPNQKGLFSLVVERVKYIEKVIRPLFDSLTWHTQKYLDYCD